MDETLTVPAGWREEETDARAAFVHEDSSVSLQVVEGRFERTAETEAFEADTPEGPFSDERSRFDTDAPVEEDTFGVLVDSDAGRSLFCVAVEESDAVAATLWLADTVDSERALRRALALREGMPVAGFRAVVPDDDALTAALAETPERCVFTGKKTRSHEITLPYRYAPALDGCPKTPLDAPRVPTAVGTLVGAVSHAVWEERDLSGFDAGAPLERATGGYRLDPSVLDTVEGLPFERFVHRFPGPQA